MSAPDLDLTIEATGPAGIEMMYSLHRELCQHLIDYMRRVPAEKRKAQHLAVIRSFLKDNGATKFTSPRDIVAAAEELMGADMPFGTH